LNRLACIVFVVLIAFQARAEFKLTDKCRQAYGASFSGQFQKAKSLLETELQESPDNSTAYFLQGLNAYINTVFAENDSLDLVFLRAHDKLISAIKKSDEHEFRKYALAELHLQKGVVALRQSKYFSGLLDLRRSYSLLEDNLEDYPNFALTKKNYYILQALLSNVPDSYRGLVEFLGYKTDQYKALSELDSLQVSLEKDEEYGLFRKEVNLYRAVLMHGLTERYDEALQIIRDNTIDFKTNPISCFIRGKMCLDSKKTSEAIEVLEHFAGKDCPFPYINYDLGHAYLYSLNPKCKMYFAYYITQSTGTGLMNDTYLRLAWWGYMNNDQAFTDQWLGYMVSPNPSAREKDEIALKEAAVLKKTHPLLIKARLTFDGGYYEYSIDQIVDKESEIATDDFNKVRYYYQLGRLYQDMNQFEEAVKWFQKVAATPFNNKEYFVPVSIFNMGLIYENRLHNHEKALLYYSKCMDYRNYPYASTYRYKSELAVQRLESE